MSRKVFISFLGTSNYHNCNYVSPDKQPVKDIKYVQEATIIQHCLDYDRFFIFTTSEAFEKNWQNNGHKDRQDNILPNEGLQTRLAILQLKSPAEAVEIDEGFSQKEIWAIFQKVFDKIEKDDEIIFDITHAFRFLPMLGMVLINYLKTLKNVKINGIYYGAFEALGPAWKVEKIPIEERNVNILDLSSFSLLQDWTSAANALVAYGDVKKITNLANEGIKPILKDTKGKDEAARAMRNFITPLNAIFDNIATCRGKELFESKGYDDINTSLKELKKDLIPPMAPLIDKLEEALQTFNSADTIINGFRIVRLCIDYNWIQQGYTILFETSLSYILSQNNLDYQKLLNREIASACLTIHNRNIPKHQWKGFAAENPEITEKILHSVVLRQIADDMAALQDMRNDINHSGFRTNPSDYNGLKKFLTKTYCSIVSKIL